MSRKVNASYTADQVKNAFKVFEGTSPNGCIKVDALLQALTTYGSAKLTMDQAQELVSQLEPDQNGLINYQDYVHMMMNDVRGGGGEGGGLSCLTFPRPRRPCSSDVAGSLCMRACCV